MDTEWTARSQHTSVALADGTIVLMGGFDDMWGLRKDVWRWVTGIGPKPELAPIVTNITPNTGENTGSVNVTISGANFESGATVKLIKIGQPDIIATGVSVDSATQISCSFDLTGVAEGAWHVVVTNPDAQTGTLPNGFTVTAPQTGWHIYLPLILK
ncbi:MAG: IPT/TIG domain-containing protein [Anaerolineae bacterium]